MTYQRRATIRQSSSLDREGAAMTQQSPYTSANRRGQQPIFRSRPPARRSFPLLRWLISITIVIGFLTGAAIAWSLTDPSWSASVKTQIKTWWNAAPTPSLGAVDTSRSQAKASGLQAAAPALTAEIQERGPMDLHPLASLSYVPSIMYHDVVGTYKQVWFDTTAAELRQQFEAIREAGVTPISMDALYAHLRDGEPLPEKAILLTFDDGYQGQFDNAYPLLQEFNYPAAYFVQTGFVGIPTSKDHFTWDQMRQMDREGLVSFGGHTINHPSDLRLLDQDKLVREVTESKHKMEAELGHEILHFAYPTGYRDERVMQVVQDAGFKLSFTMDPGFTGQSPNLLEVRRFNQFKLTEALVGAQTLTDLSLPTYDLRVASPLQVETELLDRVSMTTIRGGRPATVHADQRYGVPDLMQRYEAPAGINGSFFSIPWINSASNVMVGPVMAANSQIFIPGREEDIRAIRGRPLVLFGPDQISFIPFDPDTMNTLEGIERLMPGVTDLFVGGAWLVKNGQSLNRTQIESFRLSSAAEFRPRAYFGIDTEDQFVIGTTDTHIDATILAQILPQSGIKEAILLDSGFSTSLVYKDQILATGHAAVGQPSRPVPHAILLYDLPELWATAKAPQTEDELSADPWNLEPLVSLVPPAQQAVTRDYLQGVLDGTQVLQRRARGPAVMALQIGLSRIARGQGRSDLLPSGPDGVYGNEVATALVELDLAGPPASTSPAQSLATPTATDPMVPGVTAASTPIPAPIDVVDGEILRTLLASLKSAPTGVLVDDRVLNKSLDVSRKPVEKLTAS